MENQRTPLPQTVTDVVLDNLVEELAKMKRSPPTSATWSEEDTAAAEMKRVIKAQGILVKYQGYLQARAEVLEEEREARTAQVKMENGGGVAVKEESIKQEVKKE